MLEYSQQKTKGDLPMKDHDDKQQVARGLLEQYRAGHIPPAEYSSLLTRWSKASLVEAHLEIEGFLQNPDAHICSEALRTLLISFHIEAYGQTGVDFFLYDRDPYVVRSQAASILGRFKSGTKDQPTLTILASVVCDPYDNEQVRIEAYRAMLLIEQGYLGEKRWEELQHPPETLFDLEKDAEWDFINACYDPAYEQALRTEAEKLLQEYRALKTPTHADYMLLLKLGRSHLVEARPEVEHFLNHSDPLLRSTALAILVLYFQVPNNWQLAVEALEQTTESAYRQAAATILGLLKQDTRDKATLHVLDRFAWDITDQGLAFAAFEAMQKIFPGTQEERDAYLKITG